MRNYLYLNYILNLKFAYYRFFSINTHWRLIVIRYWLFGLKGTKSDFRLIRSLDETIRWCAASDND